MSLSRSLICFGADWACDRPVNTTTKANEPKVQRFHSRFYPADRCSPAYQLLMKQSAARKFIGLCLAPCQFLKLCGVALPLTSTPDTR